MPADIRSFFGGKGGSAPSAKPKEISKPAEKKRRGNTRTIVEDDSDDEPVVETKKSTPQKAKKPVPISPKVQETSTSDYFASSGKGKPTRSTPVRSKPKVDERSTNASTTTNGRASHNHAKKSYSHDDSGDEIVVARKKKKADDDDYFMNEDDDMLADIDPDELVGSSKRQPARSAAKKRKSPELDSDEENITPKKEKKSPTKPPMKKGRAPASKKGEEPAAANSEVQAIFDSIPTVKAPSPPPKDPNTKFDWRKAQQGGGNSGPPPAAGSKEIPIGAENCLAGLTFVFTGLLETLPREEAQELVKRYGGKVTGAPSSKTSYVVLGSDAGPSKLEKIRKMNIKTINEDGLLTLIERLPANGGDGQAAEKYMEKKKADEEKMKQEALEMEQQEKKRALEAQKEAQRAATARGVSAPSSQPSSQPVANSQLWTTKYAPSQMSQICGNKGQVEKIQNWLRNWPMYHKYKFQKRGPDGSGGYRAVMIHGPPGIGKTTAAHLAAKLEGYDVLESNASDTRSKKLVETGLNDVLNNSSLLGYFAGDGKEVNKARKKIVLIMDEVDGMSAGDRGGVGALAKICKKTDIPMILICNERRIPKMKPFDFVTFDIPFRRPTVDQIKGRIMTICYREGLKLPMPVIEALIEGSNKDIRQIVNMISTIKLDQVAMDFDKGKEMSKAWEKHVVLKPWDICHKLLGGGMFAPSSKATLNDKIELYFNDHEFSYLMVQENYLTTKPMLANGLSPREAKLKTLELVDSAAESISDGDLIDRMIHGSQQHWSLMPTHAVFSTVRPASFMAGAMTGQTQFTSWLGNNSKSGKLSRYVKEIQSHMRLRTAADRHEIRQQYLPTMWTRLIDRLQTEGKDCVDDVVDFMDSYYLTREDFDYIMELGLGPQDQENVKIETQTKASFTRNYNSRSHPMPFMKAGNITAPSAAPRAAPDLEEAIDEAEDMIAEPKEEDNVDEDVDISKDKYIKQPKKKTAPKKSKKAKADDDGEEDENPRKKAKTTKARGKK